MDDDSGAGLVILLAGVLLVVYVIALVLAAIVLAVAAALVIGLVTLAALGAGAGMNLLVRQGIGVCAALEKREASPMAARCGLVVVYVAPWLVLLCLTPLLTTSLGLIGWGAGLFVAVPAYYWTWWNGHHARSRTVLSERRDWVVDIPEFHLEVGWPMDATMQAEERILYARFLGHKILAKHQAKVWMLEAKENVRERWGG